jgi:hypothetical protein
MARKYDIYLLDLTDDIYIQRNVASGAVFVPSFNAEYNFEFNVAIVAKGKRSKKMFEKNFEPYKPEQKELNTIFNDIKPFLDGTDENQAVVYMTATDPDGNRCSPFVTMMFRYAMSLSYGDKGYDPTFYNAIRELLTDSIDLKFIEPSAYTDFFDFQEKFIASLEIFFNTYIHKYNSKPNKNQIKEIFKPFQSILDIKVDGVSDESLKIFFRSVISSFEEFLKDQKLAVVCKNCGMLTSYHSTKIACSDKCRKSLQNKRQYQKALESDFS